MAKELDQKIPVVIPLVVYHGRDKWKIKTSLGKKIRGYEELPEDVRRFIPNYQYLLYDLSTFSDKEIKGEARLRIILSVFRDIFKNNSDELLKVVFNATQALDELEDQVNWDRVLRDVYALCFQRWTPADKSRAGKNDSSNRCKLSERK